MPFRRAIALTLLVVSALGAACSSAEFQLKGDLTFRGDDAISIRVGKDSEGHAVARASDGSVVVAGLPGVMKINADGAVDARFGDAGVAKLPRRVPVSAIAIDESGRIVVLHTHSNASDSETSTSVTRFTPSGEIDRKFGHDGTTSIYVDRGSFSACCIWVDPEARRIVVAGSIDDERGFLAALKYDGKTDPGFGDGGRRELAMANPSFVRTKDGFVASGANPGEFRSETFATASSQIVRLDASGVLGPSANGPTTVAGNVRVMAVDTQGRLVARVVRPSPAGNVEGIVRLLADGSRDATFAAGEALMGLDSIAAIASDKRDNVVVAAYANPGRGLVRRFTADGAADVEFGERGRKELGVMTEPRALDASGERIVLVGTSRLIEGAAEPRSSIVVRRF